MFFCYFSYFFFGFNKYFDKGTPIYLEGRIKSTEYDKQGVKVRQTNVYANDIKFSEDKPKSERQSQQSKAPAYVPQSYAEPEAPAPQIDTAFEPELPF